MSGHAADQRLPELRGELQFSAAAGTMSGDRAIVFDPLRQRYFQIDGDCVVLLALWRRCTTAEELAAEARQVSGLTVTVEHVAGFRDFLEHNNLVVEPSRDGYRTLAHAELQHRQGWVAWLIHNYLFIRIPLLRPEPMLRALLPFAAPMYSRAFALIVALSGVIGLYLVTRQWDQFLATFPHFFSFEGVLLYGATLIVTKSLHELGHALTATRLGVRVPTMGICLMVMLPMLYTDASDAWKLASRRQRLAIDAAGIVVEMALACFATLLWAFLPDGPMRSVAFAVATAGWVLSLGLNLNPFMRFDGYYMLSDVTGIDNLQPRAFAIGRWRLRETLFGLGAAPPEPLPARRLWMLSLYAWATWAYRAVLFTGIAVLVYHMTFKALGLVLFAIEIVYFVALPVGREIAAWRKLREKIMASPRAWITGALAALIAVAIMLPLPGRVRVPAVVEAGEMVQVFPRTPGVVSRRGVEVGTRVAAGDVIVELGSHELEQEVRRAELQLRVVALRLARRAADRADRAASLVLEDEAEGLRAKLAGLAEETRELSIRAPRAGTVVELGANLHVGRILRRTDFIALIGPDSWLEAHGLISEDDIGRLDADAPALFVPENLEEPARIVAFGTVSFAGVTSIDIPDLASHYGGGIAVRPIRREGEAPSLVPVGGHYRVSARLAASAGEVRARTSRGTIVAKGRAQSVASRLLRQVLRVLVRESGT